MLKKIALLIMLVLPMGVFAQSTLKFGHMTSTEIIPTMPEYTKALSELQALEKNYTDEIQRTQEEFSKKYQVAISYDFGLVEVAKDLGMKNRNLMISLGYMF